MYICLTPALLRLDLYYIIYRYVYIRGWRVVGQKLFILKQFKAPRRHLALVLKGLPGIKHDIVRLY
jgi:hypothetical protein